MPAMSTSKIFILTARIENEAQNALSAKKEELARQMIASVMSMQASEMPPTAAELAECAKQEANYAAQMAK